MLAPQISFDKDVYISRIGRIYLYTYENRPTSKAVMLAPQISFDKDAGTKNNKVSAYYMHSIKSLSAYF